MIKFKFKKTHSYEGETKWVSDVVKLWVMEDKYDEFSKPYAWGRYMVCYTYVYAEFFKQYRWPTDPKEWFGYTMDRHFFGEDRKEKAEEWLNFLGTYPPKNCGELHGVANAPDMEGD